MKELPRPLCLLLAYCERLVGCIPLASAFDARVLGCIFRACFQPNQLVLFSAEPCWCTEHSVPWPCAFRCFLGRRGLSSFFGGKSRSFTSLAEVTGIQSIQELAKPVRHYNRRKRISHAREGCSPGGGAPEGGPGRRMGLGVSPGKEPRGLFKKGGGTRQVLGIQAGLAMAVAMGALDSQGQEEGQGEEGVVEEAEGEEARNLEASQHVCGMETVMEESAEGSAADQGERRA